MKNSRIRPVLCLMAAFVISGSTALAQAPLHLTGTVQDIAGRPVANARVTAEGKHGPVTSVSDASGHFALDYPAAEPFTLRAVTDQMQSEATQSVADTSQPAFVLVLRPSAVKQEITVTATRSSVDLPATSNTVYVLNRSELQDYPAQTLDDKLRQEAGFELFRRSSSRVQNPTSQGISMRGLGSTAASRSLVLQQGVPLNDAFGGWIHWNETPQEAVDGVALATGGGSDLYGSSALGGVIDIVLAHPQTALFDLSVTGGGQDTSLISGRADFGGAHLRQLVAVDSFRTAGYVPIAPELAGPADVPSNVHYQAVHTDTSLILSGSNRLFVTGNVLNEARNNGTVITKNGTRLWRYVGGSDWSATPGIGGRVRLFGSHQGYRQTFSSTNASRTTDTLTRRQFVHAQELGASADATAAVLSKAAGSLAVVGGVDVRDIRGTDAETPIAGGTRPNGLVDTSSRQRFIGGFGEALGSHGPWSAALSLRIDSVQNLGTRGLKATSATAPTVVTSTPNRSEIIPSPRFGIVRQLGSAANIHASVFRAFRTPTMNELYRTGQVGAISTLANSRLVSERATGWEIGASAAPIGGLLGLSATYFWTEINRPVSTVPCAQPLPDLCTTVSSNQNVRENLGQIISQGTELRASIASGRAVSASLGYQYAHAVVTSFSAQQALVGNWIPQVPRQSFTAQLRGAQARLGDLTLSLRATGHAYDDSSNNFELAPFVWVGLFGSHDFGPHWTASLLLDNLLNQRPQVARTPNLSLGSPFLAQGGVAFHWSGNPR